MKKAASPSTGERVILSEAKDLGFVLVLFEKYSRDSSLRSE
jgi:hypothetical protein